MRDHPTRTDLHRFVRGELPAEAAQPVVTHLMRRCEVCLGQIAQLGPSLHALLDGTPPAPPAPPAPTSRPEQAKDSEYDPAIDRAFAAVALHGLRALSTRAETRRIKAALAAAGGPPLQLRLEEWGARYAVFEALLERSWEVRFDDLRQMIELTRRACQLAPRLGADGYGERQVEDFAARAWGEHANALRAAHRLARASEALERAVEHAGRGTGDARLQVRLQEVRASLLANRRRYDEAVALLEDVYLGYRALGDRQGAATSLVTRATYTGHAGRLELSARLLDEAIDLLDDASEPALRALAIFNRIWLLADAGEFRKARTLLWRNRPWLADCEGAGRITRAKLMWLEGHINAGLGELERAERSLREAAGALPAEELPVLHCELAIELAAVCLRQDRCEEAQQLATEGARGLLALDLPREGERAVAVLHEALERRAASVALLQSVARFLRRSQVVARARFDLGAG